MKPQTLVSTLAKAGLGLAVSLALAAPVSAAKMQKKYDAVDVQNGGTLTGKVLWEGALPADAVEQIAITKNNDVCGNGDREVVWVDVKDGALRGAFVFIDRIAKGKAWPEQAENGKALIVQKGCRFHPWAQVIRQGAVIVRNSDQGVLHNINARELIGVKKGRVVKKGLFNFGQPEVGDIEDKVKPRRSPYIAINCEAHNFMFGFMMAPTHPYATVVGADGSFSIGDVPPGKYTLKAWHPRYGVKKAKITVEANGSVEVNFAFSEGD